MLALDICYICGYHGTTEIAHTRPNPTGTNQNSKIPYFPSLLLIAPASASKPPSTADGHVRLCLLCFRLLVEQWRTYENRKTPISNRQYWFKCCSATRDPLEQGDNQCSGGNRSSTSGADVMDTSRSPTPRLASASSRDMVFNRSAPAIDTTERAVGQDARRVTVTVSADVKVPVDSKFGFNSTDHSTRPVCVVCSRGIDSMDVCRRLPAHLVAQITDLKPTLTRVAGQPFSAASLTGEVLVCDDCFAVPSFQNAWLDCCRRGSVPLQAMHAPTSEQLCRNARQEQAGPFTDQEMSSIQPALNNSTPNLTESQREWFALYEHALLQFRLTGHLDPMAVGQLQQLAAAETLASLQLSGFGTSRETEDGQNGNQDQAGSTRTT